MVGWHNLHKTGFVPLLCLILALAWSARAGEGPADEPRFQWGGAVELGYRFTDVSGSDRYREVVNLDDGLKLFDLNLWLKDLERKGAADEIRLRLNGIGDPFPSGRLDVKKHSVYQLSADYREYQYFFDRQDASGPFSPTDTLLTDNHDLDQKRRRGSISLSLFPGDDIRLTLGHSFAARTGEAGAPRALTFAPNLTQNLDERFSEYFGSVDFPLGGWDVHVRQSFSTYDNRDAIDQFPPLLEKRDESVWTYVSTLKGHTQLGDRWDLDAGYVLAHSEGDSRLDIRRNLPVQVGPGDAAFVFDTHVVEMGLSHLLRKDLVLHLDYRFHTFDQDGRTDTDLFFLPETSTDTEYSLLAHTATLQAEYTPFPKLTLKAGYRVQYRRIEAENFQENLFDGGETSGNDSIFAHGWVASADWKPFKSLSLSGEYEGEDFDNPYTRISPEGEQIAKARIRYDTPIKGLSLKGTTLWKRRTNPDQQYRLDIQDYVLAATYQPSALPGFTLDASYTFERIRDKKDIVNQEGLRPPPPLYSTFVFDSDAHVFSGGLGYEGIYKGLGGRFAASFARTSEENEQKYAVGTLSFWYKNRWVIPVLTLERSYLTDYENRDDSYSANLVTLSLRKEF
ncbi:MAG: hypothetical protein AB9873_20125 [Syntrophobacteraceae bacterium]